MPLRTRRLFPGCMQLVCSMLALISCRVHAIDLDHVLYYQQTTQTQMIDELAGSYQPVYQISSVALNQGDYVKVFGQLQVSEDDSDLNEVFAYLSADRTGEVRISSYFRQWVTAEDNHHMSFQLLGAYNVPTTGNYTFKMMVKKNYSSTVIVDGNNDYYGSMSIQVFRNRSEVSNPDEYFLAPPTTGTLMGGTASLNHPEPGDEVTSYTCQEFAVSPASGDYFEVMSSATAKYVATDEACTDMFGMELYGSGGNIIAVANENISYFPTETCPYRFNLYRFTQSNSHLFQAMSGSSITFKNVAICYENIDVEAERTKLDVFRFTRSSISPKYVLKKAFIIEPGNVSLTASSSPTPVTAAEQGFNVSGYTILRVNAQANMEYVTPTSEAVNGALRVKVTNNAGAELSETTGGNRTVQRYITEGYPMASLHSQDVITVNRNETISVKAICSGNSTSSHSMSISSGYNMLIIEVYEPN